MTFPYLVRLLCLCLASFFLVHFALGLVIWVFAPVAIRMAERIRPRAAARMLLALRLLPLGFSLFVVTALCVPSYLWLEPEAAVEDVGLGCLVAALLGIAIWGISITRGLRATTGSFRYIRHCQRIGRKTSLQGELVPVWIIEGATPFLALAGIVNPRLVASQALVSELSAEQLEAALRHERAHWMSRDNLKRLFILLAPDIFPFLRGFGPLERGWARFTEWAADDSAVAGNPLRSLSLASALVRVARMGAAPQPSPLVTSLVGDGQDLSARVDRLLRIDPPRETSERRTPILGAGATLMLAASVIAVVSQPATFHSVHRFLEHLIR